MCVSEGGGRERARLCVCVCVCVREREKETRSCQFGKEREQSSQNSWFSNRIQIASKLESSNPN